MNHTLEQLPASIARLGELRKQAGREARVEVTTSAPTSTYDDVRRAADAGVDRLIVRPWQRTSDSVDGLRRFADDVMAKLIADSSAP